ncbi:MAG: acetyl-CoA acetyltransferase [Armatimonadota bacterium]|nr:acetyl-CoA acetyltransferase [Armatimonadota bacterium]
MSTQAAIVGVGWAGFRPVTPEASYKELMYEAAEAAYADAGFDPRTDVDSFVTVAEDFHEGTSIFDEYVPDQLGAAGRPVHTITGDGLHGLAAAVMQILTGRFRIVVVEGHSKASNILTLPEITAYAMDPVLNRPLGAHPLALAGLEASRYLHETGTSRAHCAAVAAKNRRNALRHPSAAYGADVSAEQVLAAETVASPLGRLEISEPADGAIVMVLAAAEAARTLSAHPIWVRGVGWATDSPTLESRQWARALYAERAAAMAYRMAGIAAPADAIQFAEVDDTYAYKELQHLEALGLCQAAQAGPMTADGATQPGGRLPVNVSGGSLGGGHLLEAAGLARALEVVLQLRGQAGARQLHHITTGLAQSWRGVPTASGAVAVLSASPDGRTT